VDESRLTEDLDGFIVCRDLVKTYRNESEIVTAVDEFTGQFDRREMTAVTGPSGSGKTTLLNLLAAVDYPDSGEITVGETRLSTLSVTEQADYRAESVCLVHADHNLIPMLTVYENLSLSLSLRRLPEQEVDRRIRVALEAVGIDDLGHRLPGALSTGQRTRAALARGLAMGTTAIIADEPTAHTDHDTAADIATLLSRLADGGSCVIVATHDPIVSERASRVVQLVDGRAVP
jgi:putative ABC transport system ATP-binding protein